MSEPFKPPGRRTFRDLIRAWGISGDPSVLSFPLRASIQPTVDADRYDPVPLFGVHTVLPANIGVVNVFDLRPAPRTGLRIRFLWANTATAIFRTRENVPDAPLVITPEPIVYSSHGFVPTSVVVTGTNAIADSGVSLNSLTNQHPVDALYVDPSQKFRMTTSIVNVILDFSVLWEEIAFD